MPANAHAADAMVSGPAVHGPETTVGELRAYFRDEHVHMALLADRGRLVGAVERDDLVRQLADDEPASAIACLDGRTVRPDASLPEALKAMERTGRRRLAVTADDGTLVGLLCLKASGDGFCSDADVGERRAENGG